MNNSEFQQVEVDNRHCVKSVRIRSFSGLNFSAFGHNNFFLINDSSLLTFVAFKAAFT